MCCPIGLTELLCFPSGIQVQVKMVNSLTLFILETPKGCLAKSADPDQMPHNVASDLGLHYFAHCSAIFQQ